MNLSRRGFLGTMVAAAVGAVANFDITRKLWVPAPKEVVVPGLAFRKDAFALVSQALAEPTHNYTAAQAVQAVIAEQLELNDLALRFAQRLGQRLKNHKALVLRGVNCELAGSVEPGLITLEDGRSGCFEPHNVRRPVTVTSAHVLPGQAERAANDAAYEIERSHGYDAFAPVSRELRPGVQFEDSIVGVATDPETGLSARAIRFKHWNGMAQETVVQYEVAGGRWYAGRRPGPMLLAPELQQEEWWIDAAARESPFEPTVDDDGNERASASEARKGRA